MANILRLGSGGNDKCRLLKVGSVTLNGGVNADKTSAKVNITSVYPQYKELTVDDICFPVTYSRGWYENWPNGDPTATLTNFSKSYDANTGIITVSCKEGSTAINTEVKCDIFILDRFGGGSASKLILSLVHLESEVY